MHKDLRNFLILHQVPFLREDDEDLHFGVVNYIYGLNCISLEAYRLRIWRHGWIAYLEYKDLPDFPLSKLFALVLREESI